MTKIYGGVRSCPAHESPIDTIRILLAEASDSTDLRDAIRCLRVLISELLGDLTTNHAAITRGISTLCTAVNLQTRLHGGESSIDSLLRDAAAAILESDATGKHDS